MLIFPTPLNMTGTVLLDNHLKQKTNTKPLFPSLPFAIIFTRLTGEGM